MKNVEDIYPLSPMQEVMLFHACTRAGADVLFNQICFELKGSLDAHALHAAWQALVDVHPALRTNFLWKGLKQAQQVVRSHVELPFTQLDWRSHPATVQQVMFKQLRVADKNQIFDPQRAPLMRITLVTFTNEVSYLIWSSHHLILDRWCIPVILYDLQGLSYQEVADAVNVPIGTIRSRLSRGRKLLQNALWKNAVDAGLIQDTDEIGARVKRWLKQFTSLMRSSKKEPAKSER